MPRDPRRSRSSAPSVMPDNSLIIAEPSGAYARRPPLVVDCSVLAAVLFDEPERESAALALAGKALFAPDLIDHELVSVAVKKASIGLVEVAEQGLSDLARLAISRKRIDPSRQWALARAQDLIAYDAAYLQLAIELQVPLATFDKQFGERAGRVFLAECGAPGRTRTPNRQVRSLVLYPVELRARWCSCYRKLRQKATSSAKLVSCSHFHFQSGRVLMSGKPRTIPARAFGQVRPWLICLPDLAGGRSGQR